MSDKDPVVIDLVERVRASLSKEREEEINTQVDALLSHILESVAGYETAAKELHEKSFNMPAMRLEGLIYALACFKDVVEKI